MPPFAKTQKSVECDFVVVGLKLNYVNVRAAKKPGDQRPSVPPKPRRDGYGSFRKRRSADSDPGNSIHFGHELREIGLS